VWYQQQLRYIETLLVPIRHFLSREIVNLWFWYARWFQAAGSPSLEVLKEKPTGKKNQPGMTLSLASH
jgi:hypothetical protein